MMNTLSSKNYYSLYKNRTIKKNIFNDPETLIILLAFCEKNLVRYLVLVISMIPILTYVSFFIIPSAYIILFILILHKKKYRISIGFREILVFLFVIFSFMITILYYPINIEYLFDSNNFWNTIFPCIRYFIVGLIFVPTKEKMELLGRISCFSVIVESIFVFAYMVPRGLLQSDEMSRAYQLLPNVLFVLNYLFYSKKASTFLISILGIAYILSMGTRGPVLILLSYFVLRMLQMRETRRNTKYILIFTLITIFFVFFYTNSYLFILNSIKNIFSDLGLSTRIIDFTIKGNVISYLSGRDELYTLAINKILERPLLGYGIYGEWSWLGWNVHNMYLEIVVHFGIVLGLIVIIWIVKLVIKAYFSSKNEYSKDLILLWSSFVFIRGIFGGSYLHFGLFFLLAVCIKEIQRNRFEKYLLDISK